MAMFKNWVFVSRSNRTSSELFSSVWGPFVPMLYHRHHKQTTLWRPPSPQQHDLYGATPECKVKVKHFKVRNKIKRGSKNILKWTKQIGSASGEPTSKLINVILPSWQTIRLQKWQTTVKLEVRPTTINLLLLPSFSQFCLTQFPLTILLHVTRSFLPKLLSTAVCA